MTECYILWCKSFIFEESDIVCVIRKREDAELKEKEYQDEALEISQKIRYLHDEQKYKESQHLQNKYAAKYGFYPDEIIFYITKHTML